MHLSWHSGGRPRKSKLEDDRFEAGATIGRYELIEPLGAGGMAEVWRAKTCGPAGFEREVVIKRIQRVHGADAEMVQLFIDEARILGLIHHPNVVQVHELGDHNGLLYLVLEYIDGPPLSRALRALRVSGRRMPPTIAAYIAREVCRALDHVHAIADDDGRPLNIVHRDVSPSNIILTKAGALKLLDFGIAKFRRSESMTRAGTVRGKPAYLAPEQIEGRPIDGRVDVFALGIVLHEMLSLEHLFAGDSDLMTIRKVMDMEIPTPSSRGADVPPALEAIVMKALERDPSRRYQNAGEMARDLDELIVAARLRVDDVVAFVETVESESARMRPAIATRAPYVLANGSDSALRAMEDAVTVNAIGAAPPPALRARRRVRSRVATAAGMALVAAALATAFGSRFGGPAEGKARAGTVAAPSNDWPRAAVVARKKPTAARVVARAW